MSKYKVIKDIVFHTFNEDDVMILKDTIIEYYRYTSGGISLYNTAIKIITPSGSFSGIDFDIEHYVIPTTEDFPYSINKTSEFIKQQIEDTDAFKMGMNYGKQSAFSNQYIQICKFESTHDANKFLKKIPRENFISCSFDFRDVNKDVCFITYAKEDNK